MSLIGDAIGGVVGSVSGLFGGGGGVSADTAAIEEVLQVLAQQTEAVAGIQTAINTALQPITAGAWVGLGSTAFVDEVNSIFFPAVSDITNSLSVLYSLVEMSQAQLEAADQQSKQYMNYFAEAVDAIGDFFGGF